MFSMYITSCSFGTSVTAVKAVDDGDDNVCKTYGAAQTPSASARDHLKQVNKMSSTEWKVPNVRKFYKK